MQSGLEGAGVDTNEPAEILLLLSGRRVMCLKKVAVEVGETWTDSEARRRHN